MSPQKDQKRPEIVYLSDIKGFTTGIPIKRQPHVMVNADHGFTTQVPVQIEANKLEILFKPCPPGYFGADCWYPLKPDNPHYDDIRRTIEGARNEKGELIDPQYPGLLRYSPDGPEIAKLVKLTKDSKFQWAPRAIWRLDVVKRNLFDYDKKERAMDRKRLLASLAALKETSIEQEEKEADAEEKCNFELDAEATLLVSPAPKEKVGAAIAGIATVSAGNAA